MKALKIFPLLRCTRHAAQKFHKTIMIVITSGKTNEETLLVLLKFSQWDGRNDSACTDAGAWFHPMAGHRPINQCHILVPWAADSVDRCEFYANYLFASCSLRRPHFGNVICETLTLYDKMYQLHDSLKCDPDSIN